MRRHTQKESILYCHCLQKLVSQSTLQPHTRPTVPLTVPRDDAKENDISVHSSSQEVLKPKSAPKYDVLPCSVACLCQNSCE